MTILEAFKRDAESMPLLLDWLGHGGESVPNEKAEERAKVCRKCKNNIEPLWWERYKIPVAEMIRKELELKRKTGIRVGDESKLHMCSACGCCIPLKIHVPLEHIEAHTTPQTMVRFPDSCWIAQEIKQKASKQ